MRLVEAAVELDRSPMKLGYMATVFASMSLPYKNLTPEPPVWETRNNNWYLRVRPGLTKRFNTATGQWESVSVGYPFGVLPRWFLAWLCRQIVQTKQKELELGSSLGEFMQELNMASATGGAKGSITRLRDQVRRLFMADISAEFDGDANQDVGANLKIASMWSMDWGIGDEAEDMLPIRSKVIVTDMFYEMALHSAPHDLGTMVALAEASNSSAMCLDTYLYLNNRLHKLRERTQLTWEQVYQQFGSTAKGKAVYKWRKTFIEYVVMVQTVYRDARVEFNDVGPVLYPSPPHVPLKGSQPLRALAGRR